MRGVEAHFLLKILLKILFLKLLVSFSFLDRNALELGEQGPGQ